ncbi:MAG: class I SAM-dependent methyltransferase [Pseudomonadota bacterium]
MKKSTEAAPTVSDLTHIDAAYEELRPANSLSSWFTHYHKGHRRHLAVDLGMLRTFASKSDTIVEFGAVPCLLTSATQAMGFKILGVDLAPERIASVSERLEVLKCDIEREEVPLEDGTADLVLFNEIFEHLRINPIFTMKEVARILKPGGTLLVSTPNLQSLAGMKSLLLSNRSALLCPMIYDEYKKVSSLGHMGHVREYTTRDVNDFLSNFGLTREEIVYRGLSSKVQLVQRLIPRFRPFFTLVSRKG